VESDFSITFSYSHLHAIHLSSSSILLVSFFGACISSGGFMVIEENMHLSGEGESRYIKGNQHTKIEVC
jgi:hypothetical protein